ncbi:glycosyltransferase [Devosia oryziradicis]|uniref:Glycosyltransferase n=1 Tax=Devosia oryziradicis TaxID=2801335 RepID=A0ABX7C2V6_9HYPH|nr:glycosyltransferase [Devosia oryziradicis]QQR37122.1 glycosyltransferase [Devosia oryziradicis]
MGKRVVFHTASLRGGGAERVFTLMANALAARGHAVTLFTWNAEGPNAQLVADDVELVSLGLPIHGEGYGKPGTLKGIARSARFFAERKPDAVFAAPEFANLAMAIALSLSGSKARFFPSFHAAAGLPSSDVGAKLAIVLSRLVRSRASRAIAVSQGVGRDLEARGFPSSQVVVINNPLPTKLVPVAASYPWQADIAAMGDGPVVATAGRLVPVKDHRTLIAAFAKLRSQRPARLVIFGEGPLEAELRAQAEALGVGQSVLLPGYVNDPQACYRAADLFVLSSTSEGFGNVLIEAMAEGVPVVSTDAPHGPREILDNGRFGVLTPVGDVDALAAAIARTLDNPVAPELLWARASDFGVDLIADRYEALLD